MGSTVNLRCSCGLAGDNVTVGDGMLPIWRFLEYRVFHCPKCRVLTSARVSRRVAELRAELSRMDKEEASLSFTPSELGKLLIDVKLRPRCECGTALRGSVPFVEKDARCPSCNASLIVKLIKLWD